MSSYTTLPPNLQTPSIWSLSLSFVNASNKRLYFGFKEGEEEDSGRCPRKRSKNSVIPLEARACYLFRLQIFWKEMVGELWWKFDTVQCGFILVEVLSSKWNITEAHLHLLILCYTSREGIALCRIGFLLCHFSFPPLLQKCIVSKFSKKILLVSPLPQKRGGGIRKWQEQLHLFVCLLKDGDKLFLKKNKLGKDESLKWNPVMLQQTKSKRCLALAYVTPYVSFTRRCSYATNIVISQY